MKQWRKSFMVRLNMIEKGIGYGWGSIYAVMYAKA